MSRVVRKRCCRHLAEIQKLKTQLELTLAWNRAGDALQIKIAKQLEVAIADVNAALHEGDLVRIELQAARADHAAQFSKVLEQRDAATRATRESEAACLRIEKEAKDRERRAIVDLYEVRAALRESTKTIAMLLRDPEIDF